jgi:opacity protein-like surface antigen
MRIRGVCGRMAGLVAGVMAMQGAWAQPYLGIGVASLSLDSRYASIDGRSGTGITLYDQLDGTGVSLGAGVDFGLAQSWRLRLQAMRNRFSARDTYGEGPFSTRSNELSASAMYVFR